MKKIKTIYFFDNGNVVAYDQEDQQVPEASGNLITERLEKIRGMGFDVSAAVIMLPRKIITPIMEDGKIINYHSDDRP